MHVCTSLVLNYSSKGVIHFSACLKQEIHVSHMGGIHDISLDLHMPPPSPSFFLHLSYLLIQNIPVPKKDPS